MEKTRILVIDDEESLCEILQFNLEVEGFLVDVAYNAEEALKKNLTQYSLILLDVMMGETSGFKLAQQLKRQPETAHIPIIFCTAKDSEDDTVIGLDIGADDYITKPFCQGKKRTAPFDRRWKRQKRRLCLLSRARTESTT